MATPRRSYGKKFEPTAGDLRKRRRRATLKLWRARSLDMQIVNEIHSALMKRGDKTLYSYGKKDECLFADLADRFFGNRSAGAVASMRRIVEFGIERKRFRLDPDNARDPAQWGLSVADEVKPWEDYAGPYLAYSREPVTA